MTTRERLLAAWRCQPVDHVPLACHFWPTPRHPQATWESEAERLAFYQAREWDARLEMGAVVTPHPDVRVEVTPETVDGQPVLRQRWHTPAGTVTECLRVDAEWPGARDNAHPVYLGDDFRTPRYSEFPFKTAADLAALPWLFPIDNPRDDAAMVARHRELRALADAWQVPLTLYLSAGMDWLIWLFPAEEAVLRAVEEPAMLHALLDHINAAHEARLRTALALGVDAVIRRGWYESTDFWSPALFREFARPALEREIAMTHDAGAAFLYLMDTGIMPLLSELATLPFDCLYGIDPATSTQELGAIRCALPGTSLWGGISGPLHLGMGTPADIERAVRDTVAACGTAGLIFGPGVGIRHHWPWENVLAYERAWRAVRGGAS